MKAELRRGYDAGRDLDHQPFPAACYAPFVSLYLDQRGQVSVCGVNRLRPVGDLATSSLRAIWEGARVAEVRQALRDYDLGAGCDRCRVEIEAGNLRGVQSLGFDRFRAAEAPRWPRRMEFALSSACNLQCVMCSGEFSSAIRANREHLPPRRSRYGDLFEQLRDFLPHLEQARFLGGEPFLVPEYLRIWDLMIEVGSSAECNVTTNGTQLGPRVRRILDRLPFSIGVSVDGVRRRTVESIRRGASYDEVMANVAAFRRYTRERGTSLSLTFCLMRPNWREFAEYLAWADELDCPVYVNTVHQPAALSLLRLDADELAPIVEHLEEDRSGVARGLGRNRAVYEDQRTRLRARLDELRCAPAAPEDPRAPRLRTRWAELARRLQDAAPSIDPLRAVLDDAGGATGLHVLRTDDADVVLEDQAYLDLPGGVRAGTSYPEVVDRLAAAHGEELTFLGEAERPGVTARIVAFGGASGCTAVALLCWSEPGSSEAGRPVLVRAAAMVGHQAPGTPVAIAAVAGAAR